ncbi:hypothetical protein Vafri_12242 [Volvox africanus]|uniref:B30.2/SPRY domain-containing protein n=1 Tax=Volvox africanus TaxID=51714 RepID=A0A8J4BAL2_9CHLO|nr:hypothetical protein Vafri_12242 [Volvox africanus]
MGCGTSRDAVAAIETVVAPPAILDYPKPVVEDADSEQEAESSLKVIHESIVARGLEASAVGPPVISSAEECMALNGLPKCVCDLHDGMSQAIQQKPMRLLKITPVLSWAFLKVYEEIDPATECHQVPYVETDDNLWKEVVTVSWRWSEQKPAVYQQGFSPMSPEQFQEFSTLLKFAQENGIKYAWIDWSCVPQYTEDSMIEVHRSKVFYARARAMRVLPTFRRLPAEGPVRLTLVKAEKVLNKRADAGSIRCAVAASIIAAILAKNHVAGREYFGRVWTLAERMARFGRNEGLCQWLSLESWLGMVVDAMLKLTEDKTSSVIYKKMLGTKAADLLEAVLAPLAAAVRVGSVQTPAAEGLEAKVAELCMAAVSVWLSPNLLAEAPTSNWLHTYLGEEARSGVYQAWREADRVWAIYSYFCWKKNMDRSAVGLRIALEALVDIAAGDRSTYVRGMFAQLGVDANATPVMEIIPQPGKQTRPSSSSCSASRPPSAGGPPSVWPPSAHTQPTVGAKVTIKYAKVNDAKSAQSGHGGWAYPMEQMLGKPGVVESVNTDGDVRVKMDDGSGSMLWNPSLVMLRKSPAVVLYPSALSSVRIGPNAALNDKYTVRFVANSPDVGAVQADYPAPPSCLIYYFEVMVVEPGSNGTIGIGFTHSNHDVTRHVGWDAGTFGLHGDNGETYFEGCSEYYGFKYGKGDVVGAALDFQRKEIFFTKNGTKGKAISISISQALYPTVSLRSSGGFVSVNFGQKPFSFNIDPFKIKVGGKVAIKSTSVDAAMGLQVGHGGWGSSMAKMLGKPGVVESVDMDGDVRVKMDDGSGSMLWNPALVLPNAAMLSPFAALTVGAKVTIKYAKVNDAKSAQSGHGGWASSMEQMLGKPGVVESVNMDYDVRVKMDDGSGSMLWNPALVLLNAAVLSPFTAGAKVTIKSVALLEAQAAQSGHGEWASSMEQMLGKTGVVESVDKDGYVRVKMDDGSGSMLWNPALVLPNAAVFSPFAAGAKVTIKSVALLEAQAAQSGHGGWASSMEQMLGKTGVVESVDKDGYVRVKMDDGSGSMLWNPSHVMLGASLPAVMDIIPQPGKQTHPSSSSCSASRPPSAGGPPSVWPPSARTQVLYPSALSSVRIGPNAALNDKYTVRFVANSPDVGAVQADYPAPPSCLIYYFEVTVVEPGSNGTIGIGFTHSNHNVTRHVGWDAGTFGLHGDNGETCFEGRHGDYGFKYGKGDVVGAALDFQRKEIFFTKNGTKGKAISISISQALYPTVSLHSSGEVVSVNFGQKPFSFNIEPFKIKVGGKVAIKSTSVGAAMGLQVGHGGWGSSMAKMLGKPGVVESVDMDGDVRVKMDDGSGSMLWNPALVLPNAAVLSPSLQ